MDNDEGNWEPSNLQIWIAYLLISAIIWAGMFRLFGWTGF